MQPCTSLVLSQILMDSSSWFDVDLQMSLYEEAEQTNHGYHHQQSQLPALLFLFGHCTIRATTSPPQQAEHFPAGFCKDKAMD